MNERLLGTGRFIRNSQISSRQRTEVSELVSTTLHSRGVETVDRDTASPEGNVYNEEISDSLFGDQNLRLVRTTKPYNPDFFVSSHTLSYLFPHGDSSSRIVTPAQGDHGTWQRFLEVNQVCAEVQKRYFQEEGFDDFSVLLGGSFSPYTDSNIIRAQNIKAAHLHTFLITDDYLSETVPFVSRSEFSGFLESCGLSDEEINMEERKFFWTQIGGLLDDLMRERLNELLSEGCESGLFQSTDKNERVYPLYGIKLQTAGLDFLSDERFVSLLQRFSLNIEQLYTELLLPVFIKNTSEVVSSEDPESVDLQYKDINSQLETLSSFDEMSKSKEINGRLKSFVRHVGSGLDNSRRYKFSLGPSYSFSVLYDVLTDESDIFLSYNPFGGGMFEVIGLQKIWFPGDSPQGIEDRFLDDKNVAVEHEIYTRIAKSLRNVT